MGSPRTKSAVKPIDERKLLKQLTKELHADVTFKDND